MIDIFKCEHERLNFGSGGYYVLCADCGAKWARMSTQFEYGNAYGGGIVGADPILAFKCKQVVGTRVAPEKISDEDRYLL